MSIVKKTAQVAFVLTLIGVQAQAQDTQPQLQKDVCALLQNYSAQYKPLYDGWKAAQNPLVKDKFAHDSEALRKERDGALNTLLTKNAFKVDRWQVKVDEIRTDLYSPPRTINLQLNPHCNGMPVQVKARDISLTPALVTQLSALKPGQEILISGTIGSLDESQVPAEYRYPGKGLVTGVFEASSMNEPGLLMDGWQVTARSAENDR